MANGAAGGSPETVVERKRHNALVAFLIRLVKEKPLGTVGAVIVLILLFAGIFADVLAPYGMNESFLADRLSPPSATYWLGTDNLGRDMLSRIIHGARISVIVGLCASTVGSIFALFVGMTSAFFGGKLDLIMQRFVDAWMCFPGIVMLIVIISIIGPGMWQVIIVLGIQYGMGSSRIVRSAVLGIKENVYVEAARAIGCSNSRILTRHILPNIMAPVIIMFSTLVPMAIIGEASLSFLGFGIPPPQPSWGGMLTGTGRSYMFLAPWMAIWPGLSLAIVVYGVNMFGDAVRDLLDPRLRGGVGRYGVKVKEVFTQKSETGIQGGPAK